MAELLIRAGAQDAALMEEVLRGPSLWRPSRVVVDAHVARAEPRIAVAAQTAGVPFIVDPQTFYLKDVQHAADAWSQLPFAKAVADSPGDLAHRSRIEDLVARVVDYQLAYGATAIVPPYVHIDRKDDGWCQIQAELWRATRRYLERQEIRIPVLAVVALGWRVLDRSTWEVALHPLRRALTQLQAVEVAFAASKVDAGSKPEERLATLIAVCRRLSRDHPVIAWQQGTLGEAAVAAGAVGYESGIAWRERCDLRTAMSGRRKPSTGGNARPVYISALHRGLPRKSISTLLEHNRIAAGLICLDITCCPNGRRALLEDARGHAIRARLRGLQTLAQPAQPAWRWNYLARDAVVGLELVHRINTVASQTSGLSRVDDAALRAILSVAEHRRQTLGRHHAA